MPYVGVVLMLSEWVDFHWEVNGKIYDFSMPGGGFVSFENLIEVLGIVDGTYSAENEAEIEEQIADGMLDVAASEAAKKFVADVESVKFSSPDLLWVGKIATETTVGALKEANGLEVEYSAELTEEKIAEINDTAVESGDWALISILPFDTEETLTVTMKTGEVFEINVTDSHAVTDYTEIGTGKDYVIYVDQVTNGVHQYYALKNDGSSVAVANNDLDALGNEFIWNYDLDGTACWLQNGSSIYLEPDWSRVVGDNPGGRYLWIRQKQNGNGFEIYGNTWTSNYLQWDATNGFKISYSSDVAIKFYLRDPIQFNFSVATNNENYGTVSCNNLVTDIDKKNIADIVATPAEGCYFVGWRLGEQALTGYESTIPAGGLAFTDDNQVLTAVFAKNYTSPATQDINEWVDSLLGNPLEADKTAHVYDYDNRIYEIELSASTSRYTIEDDISIEFITDISRSMYFPETLLNEQDLTVNGSINLGRWLLDNGDPGEVYYVIGDIDNTATMYAVYFSGNDYFTRWSYVDASYYLPYDNASTSQRIKTVCEVSNGRTTINVTNQVYSGKGQSASNLQTLTGKIYTADPKPAKDTADWDRLSYLTAAVNAASRAIYALDPGAKIGLVTFASSASGGTLYGIEDQDAFYNALRTIQPVGGTNQAAAFNLINRSNPPVFSTNSGRKQIALLITDGAPQGTTWDAIERDAGTTKANDVEVWTLGLGLERVGNNKQKLMDLASNGGYAGNAEDANQLVTEVENILQQMLTKATVVGEISDTVNSAFYPVDSSGQPIEAGYYYADTNGGDVTKHSKAPSDVNQPYYEWLNDNGTWTVTYYNQDIKWPDQGGWNESFYIKAKEDFMGGNTVPTNSGFDNRVEANRIKHRGSSTGYYWLKEDHSSFRVDFDSPHVNVDELSLNENSTEWTVYLGTDVDPAAELRELWNKIRVNQVVKENGIDDEVITITNKNQMYYSDALDNDAASPNRNNETLPLSYFITNSDIVNGLIRQLDNGQTTATASMTYRYLSYAHSGGNYGSFDIVLTKTVNQEAADDNAPQNHETKETGQNREVYTLTVTYNPVNNGASETYDHTTIGYSAGKIADGYDGTTGQLLLSENTHKIHVFARDLEIQKKDVGNRQLIDTAKFKLYRTAKKVIDPETGLETNDYETGTEDLKIGEITKKVVPIDDELTTTGGKITVKDLSYAPDGTYYLVETKAPDGYTMPAEPIEMHLYLDDAYTHYLAPHDSITKAQTVDNPYNWTQSVNRFVYNSSENAEINGTKITIEVLNTPGVVLPFTGGPGTWIFSILGSILILGAGVLLWRRRRMI